jgi:hypothetical protein
LVAAFNAGSRIRAWVLAASYKVESLAATDSFMLARPRINRRSPQRRMGAADFVWATFPRPHANALADLKPVRHLHALWPGLVAQIVTAALAAG